MSSQPFPGLAYETDYMVRVVPFPTIMNDSFFPPSFLRTNCKWNTAQTAGPVCRLDLELSAKSRPPTWNVNTARTGVFLDLIGRKTLGPIDNVVANSNSILTVVEDSCCLFFQPVKFYWVQTTWSANHVSNQVSHICLLIL